MRLVALLFGLCGLAAPIPAAQAGGLDAVQYFYSSTFAAGSQSSINVTITPPTPTGKTLVVQTISVYRFPAQSSTLQTFIAITSGGRTGYFALPDIVGGGSDFYPATTMNLTAYLLAGQHGYANFYRTGGASLPAETDYVTVSGYLTAN
jgi:hypothetical protein